VRGWPAKERCLAKESSALALALFKAHKPAPPPTPYKAKALSVIVSFTVINFQKSIN
jgi:hypothetical protein